VPASGFGAGIAGEDSAAGEGYDEAEPVASFASSMDSLPPADDEDGPPLEELEAQMRGELAAREAGFVTASAAARRAAATDDEDDGKGAALPDIDELVARLPADVRETLDELFRARFVSVKKLPKRLLRPALVKRAGGPGGEAP